MVPFAGTAWDGARALCIPKRFQGIIFSCHKNQRDSPTFPIQLLLFWSVKVGRAAGGAAPAGKWPWRAASQGRRAEGGIQTATCFWGHKTCLYNDIFATASAIQDTALSKTLPFPGPLLGAPRRMELGPVCSITTGNTGRGAMKWPQLYFCPWYKCLASSGPQLFILLLLITWQRSKHCLEGVYFCATLGKQSQAE